MLNKHHDSIRSDEVMDDLRADMKEKLEAEESHLEPRLSLGAFHQ